MLAICIAKTNIDGTLNGYGKLHPLKNGFEATVNSM